MFRELFPILSTPDIRRALTFYRDPRIAIVENPDGNRVIVGYGAD